MGKLHNLFSVPQGQTVGEKQMLRAMIATVCSILVCMACMAGSAWAWFSVGLESGGNAILVGQFTPEITVTAAGGRVVTADNGVYSLDAGEYVITVDASASEAGGCVAVELTDPANTTGALRAMSAWAYGKNQPDKAHEITLKVVANAPLTMTLEPCWGIPASPVTELTLPAAASQEEQKQENEGSEGAQSAGDPESAEAAGQE